MFFNEPPPPPPPPAFFTSRHLCTQQPPPRACTAPQAAGRGQTQGSHPPWPPGQRAGQFARGHMARPSSTRSAGGQKSADGGARDNLIVGVTRARPACQLGSQLVARGHAAERNLLAGWPRLARLGGSQPAAKAPRRSDASPGGVWPATRAHCFRHSAGERASGRASGRAASGGHKLANNRRAAN